MDFMKIALKLADEVNGLTSPNPPVGAVIVSDGVIVGKGSTQSVGHDHAEIVALKMARNLAQNATLYTTLEPCTHVGLTPPCTVEIIKSRIANVHISMLDPNPQINGTGVTQLKDAGIKVTLGKHLNETKKLYEAFEKYIRTQLPFVTAKFAMTLDGKTATKTGDSKWITSQQSRDKVHQVRSISDGILVGVNTIISDNPRLTARTSTGHPLACQPLRIILDSQGRTPTNARIFSEPGSTLIASTDSNTSKMDSLKDLGVEILTLPQNNNRVSLLPLLTNLAERGVVNLLVEGGGTTLSSFLESGVVDKILAFISPTIIGGKKAFTPVSGDGLAAISDGHKLKCVEFEQVGPDILVTGYTR